MVIELPASLGSSLILLSLPLLLYFIYLGSILRLMNNTLTIFSILANLVFVDPISHIGNEYDQQTLTSIENIILQDSEQLDSDMDQAQDLMDIFTEESDKMQSYLSLSYLIPTSNFANKMDYLYTVLITAWDAEQDHPDKFSGFKKAIDDLNVFYKGDLMDCHQENLNNSFLLYHTIESNYKLMQHYQEKGEVEAMSDFARKVNHDYLDFLKSVEKAAFEDIKAISGTVKFLNTQPKDIITQELFNTTIELAQNRLDMIEETKNLYHGLSQSSFEICGNEF